MSQAAELLPIARASETKLVTGVCFAHLVSHYYFVLLAPLFVFIRADYGASYTELALALTIFSGVSTVAQTPVGFLIDRTDARLGLIGGLLLGSAAIAVAGFVDSFWVFLAMFGVLGLANTVYHPADYSLLSGGVAPERLTQVFSYHTCAGMAGSAIAPITLLFMQSIVGWRGAFIGAALLGFIAALVLLTQREPLPAQRPHPVESAAGTGQAAPDGWQLLLSPPILFNLAFFFLLAMTSGGLNQFMVVGLAALHNTPLSLANTALTGLLVMSAVGVLIGGVVAARTSRHGLITGTSLLITGAVAASIGLIDPSAILLVLIVSLSGFAIGFMLPSRDMIVRSITPAGSFGKVFGFVTTGLHIGGMIAPLVFGQLLDHGHPRWVFFYIATCAVLAVGTVIFGTGRRRS